MVYINGEWIETNDKLEVKNHATNEIIQNVSTVGEQETAKAIESAKNAYKYWKKTTVDDRIKYLKKVSSLLNDISEDLAVLITKENGKPITDARMEVKDGIDFIDWYIEEARRVYGDVLPASHEEKQLLVLKEPVGVCAAITPWNFPLSMITRKVAPAIAAGCTVVLKPAPETPLSAIEILKIFEAAGIPKGVINLVTGNAEEIGEALLTNKDVRMITFTGSTIVGKYLMKESADQVKKVALELGGHAPFIAFEDADLEKATSNVLASKFRNNGQTCICTNRLYVHESILKPFTELLMKKIQNLKLGNGLEEDIDLGPLINEQALEKVEFHVQDALAKGSRLATGGKRWEGELSGNFFEPTLLTGVEDQMKIMFEETFGPVIPIQSFTDEDEVIQKANDTDYGLAAFIFTENTSRSLRVAEQLEYGMIGVNDVFPA